MTAGYVMLLVELRSGDFHPHAGSYVLSYDADAESGRGRLTTTRDPGKAKTWPTSEDATKAWTVTSRTRPVRSDGRPNRPLTAWSVEIMPLGDALAAELRHG
jgi:hypothetical protein